MVKNSEHPKRTISFPKKGDEHSCHFQGDSPLFSNLRGQASQQVGVKGGELELDILILALANFKNLWKITICAEEFFSRRCGPESVVHSPQSVVHSLCYALWCFLHNVVGEPLTGSVNFLFISFRALWSQCFEKQKYRFPPSSKCRTGMDSEMMQDVLFENEQKNFLTLKHADTVASPRNGLLHWKMFHSSLFK